MFTLQNRVKVWRRSGFKLELFDTGKADQYGKCILAYRLRDGKEIVFEGDDFHLSPMHAIDSMATVYSLLGFLSLQSGDTDSEYFEAYTPRQLEWSASNRCEELAGYCYGH